MKSKCRQTNRDGRSTGHSIPHSRRSAEEVFFRSLSIEELALNSDFKVVNVLVLNSRWLWGERAHERRISPLSASSESEMFAQVGPRKNARARAKHVGTRVRCTVPPPRARGSFSPIDNRIVWKRCTESRPPDESSLWNGPGWSYVSEQKKIMNHAGVPDSECACLPVSGRRDCSHFSWLCRASGPGVEEIQILHCQAEAEAEVQVQAGEACPSSSPF
jgi:hypothetical protein